MQRGTRTLVVSTRRVCGLPPVAALGAFIATALVTVWAAGLVTSTPWAPVKADPRVALVATALEHLVLRLDELDALSRGLMQTLDRLAWEEAHSNDADRPKRGEPPVQSEALAAAAAVGLERDEDGEGPALSALSLTLTAEQWNRKRYMQLFEKHSPSSDPTTLRLRARATEVNRAQTLHNIERFPGLLEDPELVVIVVMVHNRFDYLMHLLDSLRKVRHVEKAILVLSTDVLNRHAKAVLDSIDFMVWLQIVYPGALQLHPNTFPNDSPNDCPRDMPRAVAERRRCTNAAWPDQYGHYREGKYTVVKHHWWWKANFVFDEVVALKHLQGFKLFLEEDYYLAPDALHILRLAHPHVRANSFHNSILVLGNYDKAQTYRPVLTKASWGSTGHNMGMAFDRKTWNNIKSCAPHFCRFDDYNWDWTLQFCSAMRCMQGQSLEALIVQGARVFHIGQCGLHAKAQNCDPSKALADIQRTIAAHKAAMFPKTLQVEKSPAAASQPKLRGNGGWADARDRELCFAFVNADAADAG